MEVSKTGEVVSVDFGWISNEDIITSPPEKGLGVEIHNINPDTAARLLLRESDTPRKACNATKSYAEMMSAKAWIYNAQPILFCTEGRLLDGRKRLAAAAMSGESFQTLVVTGVPRDTVHTLDQHRRRSYAGVLEARGIAHAGAVIRCMAKLIRIERGAFGKPASPISWSRYDQVLELNDHILDAVALSEKSSGCPLHSTARPVIAYMAINAGIADRATEFFSKMSDHGLLSRGHPAKELALQLAHDRSRGIKPEVDEMIVMGIQALNDMVDGKETEAPYGWTRDFGDCRMDESGAPSSRQAFLEKTPANLGMPQLKGYKGITLGTEIMDAKSTMIDALRSKGNVVPVGSDIRTVFLSPEVAKDWLERYNTSNRKIQQTHVTAIARDIRGGNWMMNAQPIAFAGNPWTGEARLLNGQHRLMAVVKADAPIEVMIATGLSEEAFDTFDTHARHSHRKYIAKGDERVLAAAAKLQWRVDNGLTPGDRSAPSATEIHDTIERHPELMDAFPVSRKKEMQEIGSSGILTFFIAHIRRQDDQISELFLQQLMDGEGLLRGNPVIKVRTKLIGKRGDLTRRQVLEMLLETWDEYRAHIDVNGVAHVANVRHDVTENVRYL